VFWWTNCARGDEHAYAPGTIFQLQQPDVAQEIYGLPEWLSALQSGLLSENATLFRRRYYLNGAHAGFVFYVSEPLADQATVDAIEEQLGSSKGVGNFKNMLVYIPKGKKDGIQIMPIADVTAKDEFSAVKNISRDDMLAAHRTPPILIGVIPRPLAGWVMSARLAMPSSRPRSCRSCAACCASTIGQAGRCSPSAITCAVTAA
jgi:PBSX family phage portal protein